MTSKNITTVVDCWLKFDIQSLQKDLDTRVIEIAQQQEEGDQSKKRLIEQSKEFKKNANEDIRKSVAPILKLFQTEIDNLSKRNKSIETLYLSLYKKLIELPDPLIVFENTQQLQKKAERVQDFEIENKQLRETLEEYNNEFAHVKNQEVTIRQLKDKIKELEEKNDQTVQSQLKEKEKDLLKYYTDKEEQAKSIQLELVKKLGETEAKNLNLQSHLNKIQTEMFELKTKQDELLNAKSCEIDLLLQDLDKSNDRAASAERLLEQYLIAQKREHEKNELHNQTSATNVQHTIDQITKTTLEIELAAKEKEISQLVDDIQKLQMKSNKTKQLFDTERLNLEEKLAKRQQTIDNLEEIVKLREDYDEMKRELNILKSIEFSNISLTSKSSSSSLISSNDEQEKSLEILLLEKNRQIQSEITQLKVQFNEQKIKYEEEKSKNLSFLTTVGEQKQLITELERDLLNLARGDNKQHVSSLQTKNPTIFNSIDLDLDGSGAAASEILNQSDANNANLNIENALKTQETTNSNSLLNIVASQRERFRIRIQDLEMETISYKQQLNILQGDIERLRTDNVKLYEKIRFLQSYDSNDSSKKTFKAKYSNDDEIVLNKYTNEYEQKLDPFSKFTNKERQTRYKNLKLHDKFTLSLGRFILSSKTARFVFCCYILIVHLLIFLTTYKVAHSETSHRDVSAICASMYKAHMADVHGQKNFDFDHHNH